MNLVTDFKVKYTEVNREYDFANKMNELKGAKLKDAVGKLFDLVTQANLAINELINSKDDFETLKSSIDGIRDLFVQQSLEVKQSYANIVKSGAVVNKKEIAENKNDVREKQIIILKPKDGARRTDALVKQAKDDITAVLSDVPVDRFKQTDSGSFVVELPSDCGKLAALQKLNEKFSDSEAFDVKVPKKILPKMTLTGVSPEIDDDSILNFIREKNSRINDLMEGGAQLSILFTKIRRDQLHGDVKTVILKMDPDIRNAFTENGGYVYIGMSRCRIYDRYWVTQCYHCQGFGHIARDCPNKEMQPVCGFCAGNHSGRDCTRKDNPCCSNCSQIAGASGGLLRHTAFDTRCPRFKSQRDRVIENTAFAPSKN